MRSSEESFCADDEKVFGGADRGKLAWRLVEERHLVADATPSEVGIRIAPGAKRVQILRHTLVDGLRLALFELLPGLAASAGWSSESKQCSLELKNHES
jgi:hypothetical protein